MEGITLKETEKLLAALDKAIDIKCQELKERQKQRRLKKVFFSSCLLVLLLFLTGQYFRMSFIYLLFLFFAYQGITLTFAIPLIFSLNREVVLK